MNPGEYQVGGSHYQSAYESWDFILDVFGGDFFLGNASKYVTRNRKKNGVEDLRKAVHYLEKYQECLDYGRRNHPLILSEDGLRGLIAKYTEANDLTLEEEGIILFMAQGEIHVAVDALNEIIKRVK
jgi:hypothetical protein